jgi:hypothetical protein
MKYPVQLQILAGFREAAAAQHLERYLAVLTPQVQLCFSSAAGIYSEEFLLGSSQTML